MAGLESCIICICTAPRARQAGPEMLLPQRLHQLQRACVNSAASQLSFKLDMQIFPSTGRARTRSELTQISGRTHGEAMTGLLHRKKCPAGAPVKYSPDGLRSGLRDNLTLFSSLGPDEYTKCAVSPYIF